MAKREKTSKRVINKMRLPSVLKTKKRQKEVKLRKNFGPTLIIILILWTILTYIFLFIDPARTFAVPLFFLILFLALLFTIATLLANTRRGLIMSSGITLFLILLYLGVGTIINLVLIVVIGTIAEIYLIKA